MRLKKILFGSAVLLTLTVVGGFLLLRTLGAFSTTPVFETRSGAIAGYDPVAYFTQGEPTLGLREYTLQWSGATWHFANAEHRDLFAADPQRYAPQFGGYCALAVSENYTAKGDPQVWAIVDERLYFYFDRKIAAKWQINRDERIARGQQNWPGVLRVPE